MLYSVPPQSPLGLISGFCHFFFHLLENYMHDCQYPAGIVAIDPGKQNSACAHLDEEMNVLYWRKLSLTIPVPYSPSKCYDQV